MRLRGIGLVLIPIIIVIIIGIVMQVLQVKLELVGGITIGILAALLMPSLKYLSDKNVVNPRIFPYSSKQIFEAGIIHNKRNYILGSVDINFSTKYTGNLKNGYFVNEITSNNNFPPTLPHLSDDFSSVKSYCLDTIDILNSKKGKLNGWREFGYSWSLDIQNELPIGKYRVKCMVFNENEEKPLFVKEDSFEINNIPVNSAFNNVNAY